MDVKKVKSCSVDSISYLPDEILALERGVSCLDLSFHMPLLEKLFLDPEEKLYLFPRNDFVSNTLVKLTLGTEACLGRAPTLRTVKKLTVRFNDDVTEDRTLAFETAYLKCLDYSDYLTYEYQWANFMDSLLEARIDLAFGRGERRGDEERNSYDLFTTISKVQTLYLSSSTVQNLSTLHFECKTREYWYLLSTMIENSPKLETLVLKGFYSIPGAEVEIGENVVKELEIQGYEGNRGEVDQVGILLRDMEHLEEVKVIISDEIENKLQLADELVSLHDSCFCNIHVF
ncbi:unnamed protein product [Cochlearia groenlandica]